MAFITKGNYKRILNKIDFSQDVKVDGEIYKKPIYYFSKSEELRLLFMQELLKNPERFAVEFYKPIVKKDTLTYIYESETLPAYHVFKDCERLNSEFKNFVIPFEVKVRAEERIKSGEKDADFVKSEVIRFRSWFKKYLELFETNTEEFLKRLDIDWNIQRKVNEVELNNSGIQNIENYNLEQLENDIDSIIKEAGRFFVNNPDKQSVIRRFQKITFLAYIDKEIYNNDTSLSDAELKEFLKYYDETFKKPTKELLVEYYRVKYNPDLSFEGKLLEQLNFKECALCAENNYHLQNAV